MMFVLLLICSRGFYENCSEKLAFDDLGTERLSVGSCNINES